MEHHMAAKKKHVKSRTKPLRGNDVPAPKTPPASISKPYTQESGILIGAIFGAVAAFIAALIFAALKFQ
jgi:hypothetical protein